MHYALGDDQIELESDDIWIAPTAAVIGKVKIAKKASIWWHAVLRGDNEPITIGEGTNIQDGAILHTDPGFPALVGDHVTVGHMAVVHGCTIGQGALVGINAVVLNGAKIGKNCLIGAKALVTEGMEVPDNALAVGAPARVVRDVSPDNLRRMQAGVQAYIERAARYRTALRQMP